MPDKCQMHDVCFSGIEAKLNAFKSDIKDDLRNNKQVLTRLFDKFDEWTRQTAVQQALIDQLLKKVDKLERKIDLQNQDMARLKTKIAFVAGGISLVTSLAIMVFKKVFGG